MGKNIKLTRENIMRKLEGRTDDLHRLSVKKLGLFGSFASQNQGKGSDLDFLVSFNETTFDNYMDLKLFLESLFKKKVDLVTESSLKPALEYVKKKAVYAKGL